MQNSEEARVFSQNLLRYMDKMGLRKTDLAKILKVGPASLTDWTSGRSIPRYSVLSQMTDLFGCEISDLLMTQEEIADRRPEWEETGAFIEMLRTRPECRALFSLAKDAKKSDIERAVKIIEALRK